MEQSLNRSTESVRLLTKNHDLRCACLFIGCWSFVYTKVHLVFHLRKNETNNLTESHMHAQ